MIKNPNNIDIYQGNDTEKDSIKTKANIPSIYTALDSDQVYILGEDREWYPISDPELFVSL